MSRAAKLLAGVAAGAGYAWAMVRRNERLQPPRMRGADGKPYPEGEAVYSDGARVSYVDTGPPEDAEADDAEGEAGAGDAEGDRPTVLMVPGADGVKETWRYQLPSFARRYRVVAADLRSTFPPGMTFQGLAEDARELMEALETGPVVLMGQSLGGAIAMRFAAIYPRKVRALVLSNTLTRVSYEHVGFNRSALAPVAMATTRYLPTTLARWAARFWSRERVWIFDDSPGRENLIDYALDTGPRTVSPRVSSQRVDLLRGLDLREELPRIGAPTLVVKGPTDAYCPPEWSREIAAGIEGAAYVEIPGTGHCSHISRPGAFNRAVLDWLEGVLR